MNVLLLSLVFAVANPPAAKVPPKAKNPACACRSCTCTDCKCDEEGCCCYGCGGRERQGPELKGYWWHPDPNDGGYWLKKDGRVMGYVVPDRFGWRWYSYEWENGGMQPCPCEYPPGGTYLGSWPFQRAPMQTPGACFGY